MKKSLLAKKIKELEKYLKSSLASEAINTLKGELDKYEEPSSKASQGVEGFVLPDEVKGKSNAYALFSDGACRGNPGPGSYAFIVQNSSGDVIARDAKAFELTTNNKMELSGVIMGLEHFSGEMTPFDEIHIYTDSKYVVDGMNSWVAGWKKRGWKKADKKAPENLELWQKLDELSVQAKCFFHWVKGHAGHPQNEHVDELANIVLDEHGH